MKQQQQTTERTNKTTNQGTQGTLGFAGVPLVMKYRLLLYVLIESEVVDCKDHRNFYKQTIAAVAARTSLNKGFDEHFVFLCT